ncbi:hypothetical protein LY28_01626 [Ruminiclostridium sufflavum DSM 19573]|uniref:Uncharacterized protein n=1 Tax=Ruminiclostridium sufflavum DSM 19573 TaxID=1121337 RepID=A0A318Y811_9FIRM|nr:hypothetical protein [Ruminiclostridium sufflavum]PYG88284.1 hypothetical protein LY28_01626 [Ruminiclostridium sufflavum DSM 19573]
MNKISIEFIDPNLQEDIEKILPSLLAQALINKIESNSMASSKSHSKIS